MSQPAWDPARYPEQLTAKQQQLQDLFAEFSPPTLELFASAPEHYRMRAEFRIWHEADDLYYAMFNQQSKERYRVDQFPAASLLINQLMPRLLAALKPHACLRIKLFQVDFLSTLSGEAIISLLYHRKLNAEWEQTARNLRQQLRDEGFNVELIGRAHKQKIVLERDYVIERLQVAGRELQYMQVENSFTQPNAGMNQQMLEWALDVTRNAEGDLLELYCGNGNFSLAMARNFNQVLATEIAKPSVDSAQFNIAANGLENVKILRMSAEEFTMAIRGEREFNRLKGIDLQSYHCNTIFVDPPRAGLDQATLDMVQGYERILYISCNPLTLQKNLQQLTQSHRIERFALFDQFPYTHHMESGVWLVRR
jgi:tRNA (uracil-5-)-methyltransferase